MTAIRSPPVRGRGLKPQRYPHQIGHVVSPPVRGRGLKLFDLDADSPQIKVAPRAGAWIETPKDRSERCADLGRPPCGGVD